MYSFPSLTGAPVWLRVPRDSALNTRAGVVSSSGSFQVFFSFLLSCWRVLAGHHPVSKPPETSHIGRSKPLKCMIFPLVFGQGAEFLSPVSPTLRALPSKRMNLKTEERCFTKKPRGPFADCKLEGFVSLFHSPAPFVPKSVYFNVSV